MLACLFEDNVGGFLPLVHLRPVFDLTCGALTIRQKWERHLGGEAVRVALRDALHEHAGRPGRIRVPDDIPERGLWLINARALPGREVVREMLRKDGRPRLIESGGTVVAARLDRDAAIPLFAEGGEGLPDLSRLPDLPRVQAECSVLEGFWDLVRCNPAELSSDARLLRKELRRVKPGDHPGAHFLGKASIFAGKRTAIYPGVVVDAGEGPVLLGRDVTVLPNAVIRGPAAIGSGTVVKPGARISGGTTIGERCKVGGEIEASVVLSWSNKQHDGFLGHSYLGSWVNIGADTNTSDLKNTYGPVSIVRNGARVPTGMQFLGLAMGDHSKSGINVMFDTGTVVGLCCNVFGAGIPPREIPSFSWGGADGLSVYDPGKGYEVMKIVMARRNVTPGDEYERTVRETFDRTAAERSAAGVR